MGQSFAGAARVDPHRFLSAPELRAAHRKRILRGSGRRKTALRRVDKENLIENLALQRV